MSVIQTVRDELESLYECEFDVSGDGSSVTIKWDDNLENLYFVMPEEIAERLNDRMSDHGISIKIIMSGQGRLTITMSYDTMTRYFDNRPLKKVELLALMFDGTIEINGSIVGATQGDCKVPVVIGAAINPKSEERFFVVRDVQAKLFK